jgi:beta-glucosidase
MKLNLPKNFIWGTATAAHQVEGNNDNCDFWLLENFKNTSFVEPSGKACDQWNRYEEDIKIMAEHSIQSYRMSIEWARIEPEEGTFSDETIQHYRDVLECCHKYGLKTCVTYQHFTSPLWFTVKGGWENKDNIKNFVDYSKKVTEELGDLIDIVCTINEANLTAGFAHNFPSYPEGGMKTIMPYISEAAKSCGTTIENFGPFLFGHPFKIRDCMMEAHVQAVPVIKKLLNKNQPVGITLSIQDHQALEGGEGMAAKANEESVDYCLDLLKEDDFIGIQTYTRTTFGPEGVVRPNINQENMLVMGYEYYPESLENVLRYVSSKVDVPLIVTENGIATDDDSQRIEFVQTSLKGVQNCLDDGIDIRGYFYWSLLDNFEWVYGYKPHFGLVNVDLKTQKRSVKPSMKFYKGVIDSSKNLE